MTSEALHISSRLYLAPTQSKLKKPNQRRIFRFAIKRTNFHQRTEQLEKYNYEHNPRQIGLKNDEKKESVLGVRHYFCAGKGIG